MARVIDLLRQSPIIPGIKAKEDLEPVVSSECKVVFLLYGSLMDIEANIDRLKAAGKAVFVNIDLIDGFSGKQSVLDYMKSRTKADGIISSKANLLRYAKSIGFMTVHRIFAIDSQSYDNIVKQLETSRADAVNIVPGWAKVISWAVHDTGRPVIGAGLVCDEQSVRDCLEAGAVAVCSTNHQVWELMKKQT
jgi:glycerol uptake operon antiterminator